MLQQPSQEQVEKSVLTFVNAQTWGESRQVIKEHHEKLLTDTALHLLDQLLEQYKSNEGATLKLREDRSLLIACRQEGIDAAFARLFPMKTNDIPPPIRARFMAVQSEEELCQLLEEHSELTTLLQQLAFEAQMSPQSPLPGPVALALNVLLRELSSLTDLHEMPRRVAVCRSALALLSRAQQPQLWASLQGKLGNSLVQNPHGNRAENLELAIGCYERALQVFTREAFPGDWAMVQNSFAFAYSNRIHGKRAENLEQAIGHYEQALQVYTREAFPKDWAMVQNNLALTYKDRIRGERAENLEQARDHCEQALQVYTREAYPERWAGAHNNLALVYRDRIRGERAENLELAIQHCEQALDVWTRRTYAEQWAMLQNTLASVYSNRIRGERAENLEQARDHYEQALQVYTREAYPERWAGAHNNLALVYRDRIRGERTENLEQARDHYEQALQVYTREAYPEQWALTQNNLGLAYQNRILGERVDNLERAIHHCEQALQVYTREAYPEQWAGAQNTLGVTYSNRIRGERAENLEQAKAHYEQALQVRTREAYPEQWAMIQGNLAFAYSNRIRGERAENLERAIQHCEQALQIYTCEAYPEQWAGTHNNLAHVYQDRIREEHAENLERAIKHYEQALQVYTLDQLPANRRLTLRHLGHLYFAERNWEAACSAYSGAIVAGDALFAASYTEDGRQAEVGETVQMYTRVAYCLLYMNRRNEALLQLEQGKTRLLAETLALRDVDLNLLPAAYKQAMRQARNNVRALDAEWRLPLDTATRRSNRAVAEDLRQAREDLTCLIEAIRVEQPDFMPPGLNLTNFLQLIPTGGALVAPLFTSQGSVAFVIGSGTQNVTEEHIVYMHEVRDTDLRTLLQGSDVTREGDGWLRAYFNHHTNRDHWLKTIEHTGQTLWNMLMEPIHKRLETLGLQEGAPVVIMPQGGLGLLPLHAAWREEKGMKRYFSDDYTVSYAPSGYALSISEHRATDHRRHTQSLLAIVNPTRDLPFTPIEGQTVASLFSPEQCQVLRESQATVEAVRQTAPEHTYLHFSCHGVYAWRDVMQSGLLLANNNRLTLADIIAQLDLTATRLVTLSACETGVTDLRLSPDEYVGLPAGFLQAGAPAVVSTLWAVDDLSTALLIGEFYRRHLQEGQSISTALREAQRWLRNATAKDLGLADYWAQLYKASGRQNRNAFDAMREYQAHPDSIPFAHPYYWAAFTASGAV